LYKQLLVSYRGFVLMSSSNITDKTDHLYPNYYELPERRSKNSIGGHETCVLKSKNVNLGGFRRFMQGFGLAILIAITGGFALCSKRVTDRCSEVLDGHRIKYIKAPLANIDRRLLSSSSSVLGLSASHPIEIDSQKGIEMNSRLEMLAKDEIFAGAVLIVDHGKIIVNKGYGLAGKNDSVTENMPFPIGSLTKPITSFVAIHQLVKKGYFVNPLTKQPLYDPGKIMALDFLPLDFHPTDENMRERWKHMTLLDLINHTSGLPNFDDKGEQIFNQLKRGEYSAYVAPEIILSLVKNDPLNTQGTYHYSNFGYHLLGKIIEQVTKIPHYEDFMNRFLQHDLGLENTGYVGTNGAPKHFATPMNWINREKGAVARDPKMLDPPAEGYSSGGLYSTTQDLQKLFSKMIETEEIVAHAEEDSAVVQDPYNFRTQFVCKNGFNITTDPNGHPTQEVWKTGAIGGYGSLIVSYPHLNSTVIILANNADYIEQIGRDLSRTLLGSNAPDLFTSWRGIYCLQDGEWETSFSITGQDGQYVFQAQGLPPVELHLDNDKEEVSFLWGRPPGETHYIKRSNGELTLRGPQMKGTLSKLVEFH